MCIIVLSAKDFDRFFPYRESKMGNPLISRTGKIPHWMWRPLKKNSHMHDRQSVDLRLRVVYEGEPFPLFGTQYWGGFWAFAVRKAQYRTQALK